MAEPSGWTAFEGQRRLAAGPPATVALAVKAAEARGDGAAILVFDDATGRVVDLDLRGSDAEIAARVAPPEPAMAVTVPATRKRGRPRLGVVAREVTLLPRQWDWLAAQPGGASVTLRRLVEEARKAEGGGTARRAARDAAYRFMAALAGDLPGYEDALRALFAGDPAGFDARIGAWPRDVAAHARRLAFGGAPDTG
ncbi:DUF2239 family protein [Zavarzinia compransoris]|uniref:DUF2239 family protein n=1 Tax=Zavarzinia marina TaxID=2911065 RepID=UPI001F1AF659|nr:DUF2239 family protein [Zavarzinia marina]MCF4166917.1 DUF2239 family protein [Zavarzinia marina]